MTTQSISAPQAAIEELACVAPKAGASSSSAASSAAGTVWFAGWLFTIGFANLVWWKAILGVVLWPFFLGSSLR